MKQFEFARPPTAFGYRLHCCTLSTIFWFLYLCRSVCTLWYCYFYYNRGKLSFLFRHRKIHDSCIAACTTLLPRNERKFCPLSDSSGHWAEHQQIPLVVTKCERRCNHCCRAADGLQFLDGNQCRDTILHSNISVSFSQIKRDSMLNTSTFVQTKWKESVK